MIPSSNRFKAVWLVLVVLPVMGVTCETDKRTPEKAIPPLDLKKATTKELFDRLEAAHPPRWIRDGEQHREMLLTELIRRDGSDVEAGLRRLLEQRQSQHEKAKQKLNDLNAEKERKTYDEQERIVRTTSPNLELLTALRRVQKKPDPLLVEVKTVKNVEAWQRENFWRHPLRRGAEARKEIETELAKAKSDLRAAQKRLDRLAGSKGLKDDQEAVVLNLTRTVESLEGELEDIRRAEKPDPEIMEKELPPSVVATSRSLPTFVVRLRSADVERIPVFIKFGGDYRSGRQARWRFEVKDAQSRPVPVRPMEGGMGGGMFTEGHLPYDETWKTALPMESFVDLPKPGEYEVTVAYHDEATIADIQKPEDLADLVVFRSKPFKLRVEKAPPRVVQLKDGSRKKARSLIDQLPKEGTIKVVLGQYDESFHKFLDPKTPAAQLIGMDWQAVPELLDGLASDRLTSHKKAWVLSVVYTITCERDLSPLNFREALPSYEWQAAPECHGSSTWLIAKTAEPKELIDRWLEFRKDYLEIREAPSKK